MARPRKSDTPDLSQPCDLTVGAIERLTCPPDKDQAFLRDAKTPGLRVRVTSNGAKTFVFEARLNGKNIRITIGDVRSWTIDVARVEARRIAVCFDSGIDPRDVRRQQQAEQASKAADEAANAITVREAWDRYLAERRSKWGERSYDNHIKISQEGGKDRRNRPGVKTKPGPLAALMPMRLVDLTPSVVDQWATGEAAERAARVRLAMRLLKAFLRWAAEEPDLKGRADPSAASAKKAREAAGKPKPQKTHLEKAQLATWFQHVQAIPNPIIAAYLQVLLLTGARREELGELTWDQVDFKWRTLTIKDKIEDERQVPLTPYVAGLLRTLPRRNEWVFSSEASESGRLVEPSIAHRQACAAAGLKLSLQNLRSSFASLCEWINIPSGISAQIQGHAPQGVREQNYVRRPLDLLRKHHDDIELWMLTHARVSLEVNSYSAATQRRVREFLEEDGDIVLMA